jgi:peptide/nickel transport system substrate-binding protein
MLLLTSGTLLAACGDDDEPAAPATPEAAGEEPQATGETERPVLRVGVQALPDSLDPYLHLSNIGTRVTYSIFDHLLERNFRDGDPPGTGRGILPMIAAGWERVDDTTLELTLRDDVVFHNGTRLTADDIVFTFNRMLNNPAPEMVEPAGYVNTITNIEVVDEYTVRFITADPDPLLEMRLTSWATWILPKAYFEESGADAFALNPVGTGPYRFVELKPDEILVLESHDEYFGGTPPASRIEFRVIPETAGRVAALVSGELDIITNIPPDQTDLIDGNDGVEVRSVPLANCHVLRYNVNHPLMADKLLRQAMNLAINRELIIETLWGGKAELMRNHQFREYGDLYNPDRPYRPFDPDGARALLEQSSYDGYTIEFRTTPFTYTLGLEVAQAIIQMWNDVGIKAEVKVMDNVYSDGPQNIMVTNWSNSSFTADPDSAFWLRWGAGTGTQREFWTPENPRFNELGEQARKTLDQQFRYEAYQELLDIWTEEAPGTELLIPEEHYGVRSDLDWLPYSFYSMDFRKGNLSFG